MFPSQAGNIDIEALSGILGSISIACWVVVFSPQIIENFRRGSADGLSLLFLIVWLAGDVFNILGAVMQGVLPTMIILAVYYTLADIVLLGQCFYYRGFTLSDYNNTNGKSAGSNNSDSERNCGPATQPTERTALLNNNNGNGHSHTNGENNSDQHTHHHQHSHTHHHFVDGTHLSPAMPFVEPLTPPDESAEDVSPTRSGGLSTLQSAVLNTFAIFLVCAAGVLGWYVSSGTAGHRRHKGDGPNDDPNNEESTLEFDILGQLFGYFCAALYLGSRIPQLLLNYRRKSTEGVSLLFFLFACIGNLTYVLSIFAYSPICSSGRQDQTPSINNFASMKPTCNPGEAAAIYWRYILVNFSWLLGSLGTLLLDMAIFVQFFLYRQDDEDEDEDEDYDSIEGEQ